MGIANLTFKEEITIVTEECCNCGVTFGLPKSLQRKLIDNKKTFYCPNGHPQSYTGTSFNKEEYENKLREAQNRIANISFEKVQLESQLNKTKHDLKRLKNGICPCCNRSFKGLHEHIKKQHPDFFATK